MKNMQNKVEEAAKVLKDFGCDNYIIVAADPDHPSFVVDRNGSRFWQIGVCHRMIKDIDYDMDYEQYQRYLEAEEGEDYDKM